MKFQVISEKGQGVGIAAHLSSEGHAVSLVISEEAYQEIGKGVVRFGDDTRGADIILYDSECFGNYADVWRQQGRRVLGPSLWTNMLSADRQYVHAITRTLGWPIDTALVGDDFCVTVWFNGSRVISTYVSLIYDHAFHDSQGALCAGMIADFWIDKASKVYTEIVSPLERLLKRVSHRGLFNVFVRANKSEYTIRGVNASLSSPLGSLLHENCRLSASDVLVRVFNEASLPIDPLERWAGGVLMTLPSYPNEVEESVVLPGIKPANLKHLWLENVTYTQGMWKTAGTHGKIGYVTARGGEINEVRKRMYRTIRNLSVPQLRFRDDIGKDAYRIFASLAENGWTKRNRNVGGDHGKCNTGNSSVAVK